MKITQIELKNFRAFYGDHTISSGLLTPFPPLLSTWV
jgi:DNA repair exonuclease SbcCD ATPase subunit